MLKIGVVLSGCGVMDGSEIHEAVLTLLAIDKAGAEAVCMAPNSDQKEIINHLTQQKMNEKRNVLVESARIARGKIKDIAHVKESDIDALIFPGGYGAAKNLCNFADKGADCVVCAEVARLVREVHNAGNPIGAICISPALIARIWQTEIKAKPKLTIGTDKGTAVQLQKMGAIHQDCPVGQTVIDKEQRLVTTPAYMLAKSIKEAAEGIEKLVKEVIAMIPSKLSF